MLRSPPAYPNQQTHIHTHIHTMQRICICSDTCTITAQKHRNVNASKCNASKWSFDFHVEQALQDGSTLKRSWTGISKHAPASFSLAQQGADYTHHTLQRVQAAYADLLDPGLLLSMKLLSMISLTQAWVILSEISHLSSEFVQGVRTTILIVEISSL